MPLSNGSILLVEDNPADVILVKELLSGHAIRRELTVAIDGEKALQWIAELDREADKPCPTLIIMDLNLPRRNGMEVMAALRKSTRGAAIPVVVLSSSRAPNDRQGAMEHGAQMYLEKPTSYAELLALGVTLDRYMAELDAARE